MTVLVFVAALALAAPDTATVLEERIDLFDPATGTFLGTEQTFFASDGRRLRVEIFDGDGTRTLLFLLLHDADGREAGAVYFESDDTPYRETFTYSADGRLRTTTYLTDDGAPGARTEQDLDADGREIRKRYFRADSTQYGAEDVLWNDDGTQRGWDFRYTTREGGASFRFAYEAHDADGAWTRRTRSRDGTAERLEVRTRLTAAPEPMLTAAPLAPGRISTDRAETSPSFAADGRTMVFARYDDWDRKEPFIGYLDDDGGWRVEPLADLGSVYNLALAPDGGSVVYAVASGDDRTLFRIRRTADGWSAPENLTARFGLDGAYPCLTEAGDLIFYDSDAREGAGLYLARRVGDGFAVPAPFFTPEAGTTFDGYARDADGPFLATRCLDDICNPGPDNGLWEVAPDGTARKLPRLPYVWGAQPVEALGVLVFTDGDDILTVPLSAAGLSQ